MIEIGDIIQVKEVGHSGTYRILHVYNDEPLTYLVTHDQDWNTPPRCFHVLQCSCTLVEKRDPPKYAYDRTPTPTRKVWEAESLGNDETKGGCREHK
jgi:hypothetical protein